MNSPSFWNDQEKAKAIIAELKAPERRPQAVRGAGPPGGRPRGLARAGRGGRRRRLRRRDPPAVKKARGRLRGVRAPLDAQRSERPLQRLRDDPRRGRRDRGLRLGRDAPADVPDVGRAEAIQGTRSPTARKAAPPGIQEATIHIKGEYAYGYLRARPGSTAWSGSARTIPTRGGRPRSPRSTSCPRSMIRSTSSSATTS